MGDRNAGGNGPNQSFNSSSGGGQQQQQPQNRPNTMMQNPMNGLPPQGNVRPTGPMGTGAGGPPGMQPQPRPTGPLGAPTGNLFGSGPLAAGGQPPNTGAK